MIRYLALDEVIELHRMLLVQTGGGSGIRDLGALESAVAQPGMTFDGLELYPTLGDKASAMAFSLINNHPFVDGNKRIGHAALETMLVLNGFAIAAHIDEQERVILGVASGTVNRMEFTLWLQDHLISLQ